MTTFAKQKCCTELKSRCHGISLKQKKSKSYIIATMISIKMLKINECRHVFDTFHTVRRNRDDFVYQNK